MRGKYEKNAMLGQENNEGIAGRELTIIEARKLLPNSLKHLNVNAREYKFIAVYCASNFNAVQAAKCAGYVSRTTAGYRAIAHNLLNRQDVVEAVRKYIDGVIAPYRDRLEAELLGIYYRRATYSVDSFYDDSGDILPLTEIKEEWKCCIDGIKKTVSKDYVVKEYVLPNRDNALQALYRFVTGQDIQTSTLPEDARKKIDRIYGNIINGKKIKPAKVQKITVQNNGEE